ncbi:hypothetical protein FKP32DRAFT_1674985 [Trametes sanguinea]|nr:hypothetical protein FKP32DRAFT_1674985 [Trametes sanguinea]
MASWNSLKARAHERLCRLLFVPPCRVYEPRDSAIVIVGGDDDVGRQIALDFSELGCTVFALCPEQQTSHADGAYEHASKVSSLIQQWHQRIKRSGRSPWGLVAPIVLDVSSETQRRHAFETVNAYCVTRNLHLVAVIVLPSVYTSLKRLVSGQADAPTWAEIVRRCLVVPISVVQDYSEMLAAASGRVVLLLASGDPLGMHSTQLGLLESAAQFLRQQLGTLGIRVSTVSAGPFAPASKLSVHTGGDTM